MRQVLAEPEFALRLDELGVPTRLEDRLRIAQGAPGRLLAAVETATTVEQARRMIDVASKGDGERLARLALGAGSAGARGAFTDVLEALTLELHGEAERAVASGDDARARAASRAVVAVEEAKQMASGNVNPQLITASLLRTLSRTFA
jgi:DNA polymerase-3 subunit delta'